MDAWHLQPIFDSYGLIAIVLVGLVLLLLLKPTTGPMNARRRWALAGLRLLVILLLLIAMLRPTRVSTKKEPQTASLSLLLDVSRSMKLPNAGSGKSRWDVLRETLNAAAPVLEGMRKRVEIKLFAFDSQLTPLELVDGVIKFPAQPDGGQTDLGSSLSDVVRRDLGKRLAGAILLSDGVQTAFDPRVEIHEAGRELARLGVPLYTVAFGPTGTVAEARDVAVENMLDQYSVFVKNELQIRGLVRVRGFVNKEIPVELIVETVSGKGEKKQTLGPRAVTAREDGAQVEIAFDFTPQEVGQYKLTLKAAEQPGELVTKNNQLSAFLNVLEGGLRVFYWEGDLRLEQKFLRRSIGSSPDIKLDFQFIDPRLRERWPIDAGEALRDPKYDVFVIGDLDATALGNDNLQLLAKAVERGKGIVMLGGYHSFSPGGYRESPLRDVLPIVMRPLERQVFGDKPRADMHVPGPIVLRPTKDHPVTRFAAADENARLWSSLPPLTGVCKFAEVKDAAGVQVLLETTQGMPALVSAEYGQGRVLAFAGDSTWRWWMLGHEQEHRRFWRQMILWLAKRDDVSRHDVWIKLAQRRFPPGAKVPFTVGANSPTGEVARDAKFTVTLRDPKGEKSEQRLTQQGEQWLGQIETTKLPGDYLLEVTATREGKAIGTARAEFMVFDQDIELSTPAADHEQLARLAAMTQEFGGRTIAPEQLNGLLEEIRQRVENLEIEIQTKWQFADRPFDSWMFLLVLISVLGAEWGLRKKWGLV